MRLFAALCALVLAGPAAAVDLDGFAHALNTQRQANGLPALVADPRLSEAAQRHAQDMAAHGFLDHQGSDGSRLSDRVTRAGYCWRSISENIAWGIPGESQVITQWMRSRGHRRNILDRQIRNFGVARAEGNYWALVLGRPCP